MIVAFVVVTALALGVIFLFLGLARRDALGGDDFGVGQVRAGVGGRAVVRGDDEAVDFRHALLGEGDGGGLDEVVREEGHAVLADVQRGEAAGDLEVLQGDARGGDGVRQGRSARAGPLACREHLVVALARDDAHAMSAFDMGAVDYIVKPITRNALDRALDRLLSLTPQLTSADRIVDRVRRTLQA